MREVILGYTLKRILLAIPLMASLLEAAAAASEPIEEILVVGARMPRPVQDVVGTVDVITRDSLIEQIAVSTEDLVRYTPGVSVARANSRFGATEFTIRGLSGNRVTTLIDRVPLADQFDVGAFSNAGQDYLIPDTLSRVEILRGPASTLFGSDALGGVIAVVTREPGEYLGDRNVATSLAASYSGADGAGVVSGSLAGRNGALSGVLHGSYLEGDERDAAGTSLEESLDRQRTSAMLKLAYALADGDRLRFKAEAFDEDVASRPETTLGFGRQFANTTFLAGDDTRRRYLAQIDYEFAVNGDWADYGRLTLYGQRSRVDQRTDERRDIAEPPVAIQRSFDYRFEDLGAIMDLESRFELFGMSHRLGWGFSVRRSEVEEQRDGRLRNLTTGETTNVLIGETMPVRDFPNSTVTESAVYLHDEIALGAVTLIPGVRFEHYRLDSRADRLFREDFPDTPVEDVTESALAPKLGLQWQVSDRVQAFAQYARGFRAPPFEDVNIGLEFAVPMKVRAIPNPDLESETSDGLEFGVRYAGARWKGTLALFGADYDDFIESRASLGFDPASGALLFQSRNIERARVYGVELSLSAQLANTLRLSGEASWTRGENRDTDKPLNTVDPPSLAARLHWQPHHHWHGKLALRAAGDKSRVDDSEVDLFEPDGYAVFDLTAGYSPVDNLRVNAGVFNLTDKTYWRWAAVRGRPVDDPLVDVLAAPGRYYAVSVHLSL
ncbi:MAG: TonB-dependent hemoglobin/transferrin/lactoferrin family receptor [Halioglobus sp.]|nr:TonB-dependent hemoglobin/transferrin/lactoferrin family receptor [Halioglobus sp.]